MPQGPHPNFAIAFLTNFLAMSPTVNVIRLPSFPQSTMTFENAGVEIIGELRRWKTYFHQIHHKFHFFAI